MKHYLPFDKWSHRYDSVFFTVQIHQRIILDSAPSNSFSSEVKGNNHHPAVYYELHVSCANDTLIFARRFSQFNWLFNQLRTFPVPEEGGLIAASISLPPKTCPFQIVDDEFLDNRQDELGHFLSNILIRPGYAQHKDVVAFLKLGDLPGEKL